MEDRQRTLAVILTMHRSGSSVATGILNRLGMSLGPFELLAPSPANPYGHFESTAILALNKDVQQHAYGFTEDLPESEEALDQFIAGRGAVDWQEIPADLVERGKYLIEELLKSGPISGFKDPRTVMLWPFWQRVLAAFPAVRVVAIAMLRSPHEIAMSLSSRSWVTLGMYGYWDCLDIVAIHFTRLKAILDSFVDPTPVVRFGSPSFLDDLAVAAQHCGLTWVAAEAEAILDKGCVHQARARVLHEAQEVYDSLCGGCAAFDQESNAARLNADLRQIERLAWRRLRQSRCDAQASLELLSAAQADLSACQGQLGNGHQQLCLAHEQLHQSHEQLRLSHEQLKMAHEHIMQLNRELQQTHEHLHSSQQHGRELMGLFTETNQALSAARLEGHELRELCDLQQRKLARFEAHPILGVALKGRRRLRRALESLRLRPAG